MLQRPVFGYDPDSGSFAMVVGGDTIRYWALNRVRDAEGESHGEWQPNRGVIKGVAFADEGTLVTVHEKGAVVGWDRDSIADGEAETVWEVDAKMTVANARGSARDGGGPGAVAMGSTDGEVALLRPSEGKPNVVARVDSAHADKIEVLTFSPDGHWLATSGRDREIGVWSTHLDDPQKEKEATLDEVCRLTGSGGWPLCVAFSSDGRRLASGCMDNGTYIWDLERGERTGVRYEHYGWVEDIAWLPGDNVVVSASWDETVGVFGVDPLRPRMQFMHHDDYVVRVLPVPNTPLVLAASYDATVSVWNCRDGELEGVLEGHHDWVTELVWVGDDRFLSLSSDRTARLWSLKAMSSIAVLGDSVMQGVGWESDFSAGGAGFGSGGPSWTSTDGGGGSTSTPLVRRFDDDPMVSDEEHDTAQALLDKAIEDSQLAMGSTSAPESTADAGDWADGDWTEVDEGPSASGLGDELSSLVLDAISDVDDEAEEVELEAGLDEATGPMGESSGAMDVEAMLDNAEATGEQLAWESSSEVFEEDESVDKGGGADIEESDDDAEAVSDVEMDVATGDDKRRESADEAQIDDIEEAEGNAEAGSGAEEEATKRDDNDGDDLEGAGDDDEISEVGLGIMDSVFDPESEGHAQASDAKDGEGPGLASPSSPEYDPQPLESPEEVQAFLPDDDILDLAFSSSEADEVEAPEGDATEHREFDDKAKGSTESAPVTAPRRQAEDDEAVDVAGDDSDVEVAESDGGKSPWSRKQAPETVTRGKPLTAVDDADLDDAADPRDTERPRRATPQGTPGLRDGGSSSIDDKGMTQTPFLREENEQRSPQDDEHRGNRTQTPFTEATEDSGPSKTAQDKTDEEETKKGGASSPKARSLLERMARNLDARKKEEATGDVDTTDDDDSGEETDDAADGMSKLGESGGEDKKRTTTLDGGPKPVGPDPGVSESARALRLKSGTPTSKRERTTTAGGGPSPFRSADAASMTETEAKGEATGRQEESPSNKSKDDGSDSVEPDKGSETEDVTSVMDAGQTFMGRPGLAGLTPVGGGDEQKEEGAEESTSPSEIPAAKVDSTSMDESVGGEKTTGMDEAVEGETTSGGMGDAKTAAKSEGGKGPGEDPNTQRIKADELTGLGVGKTSAKVGAGDEKTAAGDAGDSPPQEGPMTVVGLEELWTRAREAPQMGILRRRIDAGVAYDPAHQLQTGMRDEVAIAVSPQEKRLVTAGTGGKMALWSIHGESEANFSMPDCQWMDVGFVDGERLGYAVDGNGRVALWLVPAPSDNNEATIYVAYVAQTQARYRCGCLDDNGELLMVGTTEGEAEVWNVVSGECERRLEGHDAAVSAVAFGKKGPVTASVDGQIRFWNRQGLQVDQIDISGEIVDLAASGGLVLWTETSGALRLMQEGASKAMKLQGHYGEGRSVAFRDDGYAVAGGEDGRLLVYDGTEGKMAQEVPIPAPIHRVLMKRKVLAASCVGGAVFVFRRVEKK